MYMHTVRRRASYRVILNTAKASNISHNVWITFLGPSGQRSREILLNEGPLNQSFVLLRVEAEVYPITLRARCCL